MVNAGRASAGVSTSLNSYLFGVISECALSPGGDSLSGLRLEVDQMKPERVCRATSRRAGNGRTYPARLRSLAEQGGPVITTTPPLLPLDGARIERRFAEARAERESLPPE